MRKGGKFEILKGFLNLEEGYVIDNKINFESNLHNQVQFDLGQQDQAK